MAKVTITTSMEKIILIEQLLTISPTGIDTSGDDRGILYFDVRGMAGFNTLTQSLVFLHTTYRSDDYL